MQISFLGDDIARERFPFTVEKKKSNWDIVRKGSDGISLRSLAKEGNEKNGKANSQALHTIVSLYCY